MVLKIIKRFGAGIAAVCLTYGLLSTAGEKLTDALYETPEAAITIVTEETLTAASGSDGSETSTEIITDGDDEDDGTSTAATTTPTLSQFLSELRCSGCRRNCSLLNPRCHNGRSKAETATVEYYQEYAQSDY